MIDISTVGAKVEIVFNDGNKITVTEFSDEGTPFDAPDVTASTNQKNLNGQMISSRTPSVYPVNLTVIPCSDADYELTQRLSEATISPGNVQPIRRLIVRTLTVSLPGINGDIPRMYIYSNGRMKSGAQGPSSSAQGRMSARRFSFEFEGYSTSGVGKNVDSSTSNSQSGEGSSN